MIYLQLFLTFFKIGAFSFGGAYGAIPLFREEVLAHGWMTDEVFTSIISISESTPGPIMVNTATYIGSNQAGFFGALLATLGVVMPSFIIILLVTAVFKFVLETHTVKGILKGIKQCIMGLILATGLYIGYNAIVVDIKTMKIDLIALLIMIIAVGGSILYKKITKKSFSPIAMIACCAVLGGILY